METKPWYASKTVWLNVFSTLFAVAALFMAGGQFAGVFSETVVLIMSIVIAVLNIILRIWFTNTTVS